MIPDPDAERCRALWAAVACLAVEDAATALQRHGPGHYDARWPATRDAAHVLELAGLTAEAARERVDREGLASIAARLRRRAPNPIIVQPGAAAQSRETAAAAGRAGQGVGRSLQPRARGPAGAGKFSRKAK